MSDSYDIVVKVEIKLQPIAVPSSQEEAVRNITAQTNLNRLAHRCEEAILHLCQEYIPSE